VGEDRSAVTKTVSLPRDQVAGAQYLARRAGHGKFSRVFQDLLEAELRRALGDNWRELVAAVEAMSGRRDREEVPA
jgi:hypothetical protein